MQHQLLNRNPKHRLGAQRDTLELKEHPFFKNIDWDLLFKKQVSPPFKPMVESDESVANFNPELTTTDLRDAAPHETVSLDEEVLLNDCILSPSVGSLHKPYHAFTPLTNSAQENFRGFTYDGLESQRASLRAAGESTELFQNEEDEVLADDEVPADDDALADKGFDDFEGERGREGDVSDDELLEWELDP